MYGYERRELVRRVTAGASWLDERFPGWERKIDLAVLDLGSIEFCMLGQVGRAWEAIGALCLNGGGTLLSGWLERGTYAQDLGFDCPDELCGAADGALVWHVFDGREA